jgi:hypothetical protein
MVKIAYAFSYPALHKDVDVFVEYVKFSDCFESIKTKRLQNNQSECLRRFLDTTHSEIFFVAFNKLVLFYWF